MNTTFLELGVILLKIIIIGTGILGASVAYNLSKYDGIETVMIDGAQHGKATTAGAGIVSPWTSSVTDDSWYQIAKRGAAYYPELITSLQDDGERELGYKKVGAICIGNNPEKLAEIEKNLILKKVDAAEIGTIQRLGTEETQKLFPVLHEDLQSVFISGAARVDGNLLRNALKRATIRNGGQFLEGEATLLHEKRRIHGVIVNGKAIHGDLVVIAAGAWAGTLLEPLDIQLQIEPQRGQIVHIKLPDMDTSDWPIVLPMSSHYLLAFDDSRIVAGATRETRSGFDYRQTAGGIHEVLSEALKVAPGLKDGKLEEVRIGFRPMGSDITPTIGMIPSLEGVMLLNGLGASGLTMGPYVGKLAASLIMKEKIDIDISPYDPKHIIL